VCESFKMTNFKTNFKLGDFIFKNFINISIEEREIVRELRNHEIVRKWMYSDSIISPEQHAHFINQLKDDDNNLYWLVQNKDEEYIGVIYLNNLDFQNKNAYLGIYSNPKSILKNKGRLLLEGLKEIAFNKMKLHSLKLEVMDNNEKAINFYKKSGFNEEGRLKEFVFKDGQWHDVIVMGIINDS